jgi:hypothetical protein
MSAITLPATNAVKACDLYPVDAQMVELSLLLPAWQAHELEKEAEDRGLTAGHMVRQVLRDFIARLQLARDASQDQWA